MSCCSTETAEDKLEPYQLRALYIRQISRFAQKGIFGQALNVFKEVGLCLCFCLCLCLLLMLKVSFLISSREVTATKKTTLVSLNYLTTSIGWNAICYSESFTAQNEIHC